MESFCNSKPPTSTKFTVMLSSVVTDMTSRPIYGRISQNKTNKHSLFSCWSKCLDCHHHWLASVIRSSSSFSYLQQANLYYRAVLNTVYLLVLATLCRTYLLPSVIRSDICLLYPAMHFSGFVLHHCWVVNSLARGSRIRLLVLPLFFDSILISPSFCLRTLSGVALV